MAQVNTDIIFEITLNQKEFSVMTRALAGHTLKEPDLKIARELNLRFMQTRKALVLDYYRQAERALQVATEEFAEFENELCNCSHPRNKHCPGCEVVDCKCIGFNG